MNITAFLEALEALSNLLPAIGAFVTLVHPGDGQEANRVATAITTANAGLQLAGATAETIASLHPTIAAAIAPGSAAAKVVATMAAPTVAPMSADALPKS